jgi:hypothetical protein
MATADGLAGFIRRHDAAPWSIHPLKSGQTRLETRSEVPGHLEPVHFEGYSLAELYLPRGVVEPPVDARGARKIGVSRLNLNLLNHEPVAGLLARRRNRQAL